MGVEGVVGRAYIHTHTHTEGMTRIMKNGDFSTDLL